MSDMSKHANTRRSAATPAAWAVLVGMGGTSVTYNIYHSVHAGHMNLGLALPYGIAPVFAAVFLSHMVAVHKGGWLIQSMTFGVMLGAMGLSIGAIASVVAPAAGDLRWLFGGVLDAAALIALRVILSERDRLASDATAREAAEALAAEATGKLAALEQSARESAEALDAAHQERDEAQSRIALLTAAPARPKTKARTARRSAPDDDLTIEARALELLAGDLSMSGAELARRLGVSPGYGRKLRARLEQGDRPLERAPGTPAGAAPERPEER